MKWLVTLCALLGCGLMAGLFFAFSVCVMRALAQLPPARGMAVMQTINVVILNPLFLAVFMGTTLLCGFHLVASLLNLSAPGARYLLAGSLCYLVGAFLVTAVFNVPLNDALAGANSDSPEGAALWPDYLAKWTPWNHVRAVASLAATAFYATALYHSSAP